MATEFFFGFQNNGIRFLVNGFFIKLISEVIFNGDFPTITAVRWNADEYGGKVTSVNIKASKYLFRNRGENISKNKLNTYT